MPYNINDLVDDILNINQSQQNIDSERTQNIRNDLPIPEQEPEAYEKPKPLSKVEHYIWPDTEFCNSLYQQQYLKRPTTKLKLKILYAEQLTFLNIKPDRLCKELVIIDHDFLIKIHPLEFLSYPKDCKNIDNWEIFNKAVHNTIKSLSPKYLLKMASHLESLNDYNLIYVILNVLKGKRLIKEHIDKLASLNKKYGYFTLRKTVEQIKEQEFYILPLDFIIKDIEESNQNLGSEIAGKRFIEVVDFFINSQSRKLEIKSVRKYQHLIIYSMYKKKDEPVCEIKEEKKEKKIGAIYLFL